MDFFEVVNRRRSVRKFTNQQVPPEVIEKAIDAALKAPNSSNLQAWEFYCVQSADKKKDMVEVCLSQGAAKSAQEFVVIVSRLDTWKKHRDLIIAEFARRGPLPGPVLQYYTKLIPIMYTRAFGLMTLVRSLMFNIMGLVKPTPRSPTTKASMFEIVSKSAALACENLMLALVAQGYSSCPMEGFDERRLKSLLGITGLSHVVMVLAIGEADPAGIQGEQFRVPKDLVVKRV